jgi:hypothetical protein
MSRKHFHEHSKTVDTYIEFCTPLTKGAECKILEYIYARKTYTTHGKVVKFFIPVQRSGVAKVDTQ